MANLHLDNILDHLRMMTRVRQSVGLTDTVEQFVLRHGRPFRKFASGQRYLPWLRTPHQCFANCIQLATIRNLTYVEGFAVIPATGIVTDHAWCTDDAGLVYDPTWKTHGDAYFGVAFHPAYTQARFHAQIAAFGLVGSLLRGGDDGFRLVKGEETAAWATALGALGPPPGADRTTSASGGR